MAVIDPGPLDGPNPRSRVGVRIDPGRLDGPLVILGGAVGTAARVAIDYALPVARGGFPVPTLLVNLVGSFLLGVLLAALPWWAGDSPLAQRRVRLAVGTGVMGGFTTFSTFSVELVGLLREQAWLVVSAYLAASLIGGLLAALAGGALGRLLPEAGSR